MTPDIERYRVFVDRFDLTEDQKLALILALWKVVEGFASRAFGFDPVQQVRRSVEKDVSAQPPMLDFEKMPSRQNSLTHTFRLKTRKGGRRIR